MDVTRPLSLVPPTNLAPEADTNGKTDVFVHDRTTGATRRVSVDSSGNQANEQSGGAVSISADGRYVAFQADATGVVTNNSDGLDSLDDVFVRERQTGTTQQVGVNDCGTQANGSVPPNFSISPDGRYLVFSSGATNLVPGDTNNAPDIFVHERATPQQANDCGPPSDTTPPMVNSTSPDNNTTGIASTANVSATFSEDMDRNTLTTSTFTLTKQGSTSTLAATLIYDSASKKATLDPASDLEANTTYTARVKGGSSGAKDLAGNALEQDYSWTFTTPTPPPDTTAPKVGPVSPANSATGVARSTDVAATFSENMDPTSINATTFKLFKCSSTTSTTCTTTQITNVTVSLSADGLRATLNPYGTSST
jgi:Big-like domain-containing protein/WD40 repeat protein